MMPDGLNYASRDKEEDSICAIRGVEKTLGSPFSYWAMPWTRLTMRDTGTTVFSE